MVSIYIPFLRKLSFSFALSVFSMLFSTEVHSQFTDENKILIVYLSRTKNTAKIAEIIQSKVGGVLHKIELKNPYPEKYSAIVEQVRQENEAGILPELKNNIDIDKYATIFIGFPTWGMQLPPPVKSFLKNYNWEGKTIVPFNTNAGYGVGSSFRTLEKMASKANVLPGFSTKGGIERDGILLAIKGTRLEEEQKKVTEWLEGLGF